MKDPRNAVQDEVYRLLNAAGITALVDPDDSDSLPYTVFGDATFIPGPLTTKSGGSRGDAHLRLVGYEPRHGAGERLDGTGGADGP